MPFNRDDLKSFGGFLLSGTMSCLSASPAVAAAIGITAGGVPSLLLGLAGSITGSFAGEHLNQLVSFSKLKERLKDHDPNNVNHDLERLFKEAAVISIIYIKKLFLAELKNDPEILFGISEKERKQIINSAEKFLDQNIRNIKEFIGSEPVDQLQIKEPREFLTSIAGYLIGITEVAIRDDIKQKLSDFYAARLPYCFELAFKESLKNDDHGFKAFQMWMLESSQNLKRQIAGDLKKVQEQLTTLPTQPLETIAAIRTAEIYQQFETEFNGIIVTLQELSIEIGNKFEEQYSLLTEVNERTKRIESTTDKIDTRTSEIQQNVKDTKDDVAIVKDHTQQILDKVAPAYVIPHHLTPLPFVPEVFWEERKN